MSGPSLTTAINALNRANKVLRGKAGPSSPHGAPDELPTGVRKGMGLTVKPSKSSRHEHRRHETQETIGHQLALAERRPSTDAQDNILSPDEIQQLISTVSRTPNARAMVTRMAKQILRGEPFQEELPGGADRATMELAAYHLALQCLEGDPKAQKNRLTALLTPTRVLTPDPHSLAKVFQDAIDPDGEEQEALIELLIELKAAGADIKDPRKAAKDLCTPGRDESEATVDDTDKLMEWLRQVLGLKPLVNLDPRRLREEVRNNLADFRASPDGAIAAKLLPQLSAQRSGVVPPQPADSEPIEDHDPDFLDRLSGLLNQFSFEQLQSELNHYKRRSGEKLPQKTSAEAEAPAVRDPALGATLKELGDLHVASTLVMSLKNYTLDFFRRTQHVALDGTVLLRALLTCLQAQPADARHYEHLLESVGVTELESKIVLLTSLKNVVQNLPAKCFASNEARIKALGAVQAALDPYVNAEEDPAPVVPAETAEAR